MSREREIPDFRRPDRLQAAQSSAAVRRRSSPFLIFAIAFFGVGAFWAALVVATQVDSIFFPGNELNIGVFSNIVPGSASGPPETVTTDDRINILVMGLDLRRDEPDDQPARSDTMFVLTIDQYSKTAGILSFPRDMRVKIYAEDGEYIESRINTVLEAPETDPNMFGDYPGGGPQLVKDTIKANFDIPIDNYVVLNFNNFIQIVDDLGGIDVDVPEYIYDPDYSDCNACYHRWVEFSPGVQHMDGETALAYARLRHSDNDFKRIERQQLVMKAVARKAANIGLLLNDPVGLYNHYKDSVKTDIKDSKMPGLAWLASDINIDSIPTESLAAATYPCPASICGESAEQLWDPEIVDEIKARVFIDGRLVNEAAMIKILNGTSTPGLGDDFAKYLTQQGLGSQQIMVDELVDGALYDQTLVLDMTDKEYTTKKLAEWLTLPETQVKGSADPEAAQFSDPVASIVVVLGADVQLPGSLAVAAGG